MPGDSEKQRTLPYWGGVSKEKHILKDIQISKQIHKSLIGKTNSIIWRREIFDLDIEDIHV